MKNAKTFKFLALLSAAAIIGCAKEKPYDVQYRAVELMSKSNFVTHEKVKLADGTEVERPVDYIYVPMILGTPMNVTDADPFFQGQEKLVHLKWSEEGLEVREVERDGRFADNSLNQYPVLTIPGEYKSFRCREDAYGECTNVEEENTELEWYDKDNFLPKFEALKTKEVNMLDIFSAENDSCLSSSDTYLVDYEVKPGVINIELEKNYKVTGSIWCFITSSWELRDLKTNSFRVRRFYSLVRRDMLATPGYQKVEYPEKDHSTFGFFAREEEKLTGAFDRDRAEKVALMERWNPGKEVVYYLSPEHSKPENKYILDATNEAVSRMNKEMAEANIPLQIKLVEQPDPKKAISPGDLRYNSIVLIEDPLANGLLGYGPAVSDPFTGEILKAHTNMYLGVLKSLTRRTYQAAVDITEERYAQSMGAAGFSDEYKVDMDALLKETNSGAPAVPQAIALAHFPELIKKGLEELPPLPAPPATGGETDTDTNGNGNGNGGADDSQDDEGDVSADNTTPSVTDAGEVVVENSVTTPNSGPRKTLNNLRRLLRSGHAGHNHGELAEPKIALDAQSLKMLESRIEEQLHTKDDTQKAAFLLKKLKEEGNLSKDQEAFLKEMARLDRYAENNAFAVEFFPIGGTSKVIYPELLAIDTGEGTTVQTPRGTLKPYDQLTEKQKAKVQEIVTKSAYIATLIHELGHNLGLRHNFMGSWDKENFYTEEEARQRGMNAAVPYSSIMDYSFSEFNQLKAFGKYDVAALRFGYSREVDLASGETIKVNGSIYELEKQLESENKSLKPYMFCTDENAGLSTLCNRFDEGTNVLEVTQHLVKRYKDRYKYANFRDGRNEFNTIRSLPRYIRWRQYEFGKIRDVLEDYEFFASIFGEGFMAQGGCRPQDFQQVPELCNQIKSRIDSVEVITDFFLEMIVTPDHMCALVKPEAPTQIVEYRKLSEIYEDVANDREINIDYVPHSCFDDAVIKKLAKDNPSTPEVDNFMVAGEVGKFFNGFKDRDPNFRFAQDRYALGIWPDKVMAFEALFQRTWNKGNVDDGHMALYDLPSVKQKVDPVLDHMMLGKPLPMLIPFETQSRQRFVVPYTISHREYEIDPLEGFFSESFKERFDLPKHGEGGKGDILRSSLYRTRNGVDYGSKYEPQARITRNLMAVKRTEGFVNDQFKNPNHVYLYDEVKDVTYSGDDLTPYAKKMISSFNSFDTLEAAGRPLALKVANQRLRPEAPEGTPKEVISYWNLSLEMQEILITVREQGRPFTPQQLEQFFPGRGQDIHTVYVQGAAFMQQIVELKKQIQNTVADDASEEEKALFTIPAELVDDYAKGLLTEGVLEYYLEVLRKMPDSLR